MTAWVIMTAMPPTKGHANLMRFAASLGQPTKVMVSTQPHEPWPQERFQAVKAFAEPLGVEVIWLDQTVQQDPDGPGFWEYWDAVVQKQGFEPGDMWVTSEPYGATLAARNGGIFMPYDPKRELLPVKATAIREKPRDHFAEIMEEFQPVIRKTVTFFGAESTGKTTLSREVAVEINGHWLYEYARPYLETVGKEITVAAMEAIWQGQLAAQRHARMWVDKPFIVQDTDLFSTVGYWMQPHWEKKLGPVPEQLIQDALDTKSDLYIIPRSNIPFEQDGIRYGIDKRESPDEYWLALADRFGLEYHVLESDQHFHRFSESVNYSKDVFRRGHKLAYDRHGF